MGSLSSCAGSVLYRASQSDVLHRCGLCRRSGHSRRRTGPDENSSRSDYRRSQSDPGNRWRSRTEQQGLKHISSTASGTGAALVRRMSRKADIRLAGDSAVIGSRCHVRAVAPLLHEALASGDDVIIEGTQGFGLSLLHGPDYPFVTSRDTSASGFASEVGLSPRSIDEIVMVVRTFPIRVGGPSGPFAGEISWDTVRILSNAPNTVPEFTSVTKKLRRVASFDLDAVMVACQYNQPTCLAVMGLDRLRYVDTGVTDFSQLTREARAFLAELHEATGVRIGYAGTGFGTFDVVNIPVEAFSSEYAHV